MAYSLIWSPTARSDFRDLVQYISEFDPDAAERFGNRIFHALESLYTFPDSGRIVPEFRDPALRELIRKPCRIVYRVDQERSCIHIVRIWHAARGIPEI